MIIECGAAAAAAAVRPRPEPVHRGRGPQRGYLKKKPLPSAKSSLLTTCRLFAVLESAALLLTYELLFPGRDRVVLRTRRGGNFMATLPVAYA